MADMEAQVRTIIVGLKRKGINFVAIDFDLTMSNIHSGHHDWDGTINDLANSIRPFFRIFVPQAIKHDIHIAVVTLSKIFDKIEDALGIVFEDDASKIVVRGDSGSGKWQYIGNGCKAGKQAHMASAAAAIKEMNPNKENLNITRSSTLLLDDQVENIKAALENGVFAIRFDDNDVGGTVESIMHLFPNEGAVAAFVS